MKVRNLGGREATLEKAGQKSITLGEEHRQIIARKKGDRGISEYIRDLIIEDANPINDLDKGKRERKEIICLKKELKVFERKEMAITQERRDTIKGIEKGYKNRLSALPNVTLKQQRNWLESQCKGMGICLIEMNAHLRDHGILDSEGLDKGVE